MAEEKVMQDNVVERKPIVIPTTQADIDRAEVLKAAANKLFQERHYEGAIEKVLLQLSLTLVIIVY